MRSCVYVCAYVREPYVVVVWLLCVCVCACVCQTRTESGQRQVDLRRFLHTITSGTSLSCEHRVCVCVCACVCACVKNVCVYVC